MLIMFQIDLSIAEPEALTGLQALDERRRLGLPDGTYLYLSQSRTACWFNVTEEFARQHFPYTASKETAEIPLAALTASDVVLDKDVLRIDEEMTDQRAMELFAAHYVKEDASCSG